MMGKINRLTELSAKVVVNVSYTVLTKNLHTSPAVLAMYLASKVTKLVDTLSPVNHKGSYQD